MACRPLIGSLPHAQISCRRLPRRCASTANAEAGVEWGRRDRHGYSRATGEQRTDENEVGQRPLGVQSYTEALRAERDAWRAEAEEPQGEKRTNLARWETPGRGRLSRPCLQPMQSWPRRRTVPSDEAPTAGAAAQAASAPSLTVPSTGLRPTKECRDELNRVPHGHHPASLPVPWPFERPSCAGRSAGRSQPAWETGWPASRHPASRHRPSAPAVGACRCRPADRAAEGRRHRIGDPPAAAALTGLAGASARAAAAFLASVSAYSRRRAIARDESGRLTGRAS